MVKLEFCTFLRVYRKFVIPSICLCRTIYSISNQHLMVIYGDSGDMVFILIYRHEKLYCNQAMVFVWTRRLSFRLSYQHCLSRWHARLESRVNTGGINLQNVWLALATGQVIRCMQSTSATTPESRLLAAVAKHMRLSSGRHPEC